MVATDRLRPFMVSAVAFALLCGGLLLLLRPADEAPKAPPPPTLSADDHLAGAMAALEGLQGPAAARAQTHLNLARTKLRAERAACGAVP